MEFWEAKDAFRRRNPLAVLDYGAGQATNLLELMLTVLGCGLLAGRLARVLRLPDVVLYLLLGLAVGPFGFGLVHLAGASLVSQLVLMFGSAYILFDGGRSLNLNVLRTSWRTVLLLATVGVAVSAAITGLAAARFLAIPLFPALLLGAVLAPTDPAVLIPLFRQVRVGERLAQTVVAESALNDATGSSLTFVLLGLAGGAGATVVAAGLKDFLWLAGGGIVTGVLLGALAAVLVARHWLGWLEEFFPLMSVITVLAAYLAAQAVGASGYMAAFAAGVTVGNTAGPLLPTRAIHRLRLHHFADTLALILRMLIFVFLGAQVDLASLGGRLGALVAVTAVLVLVARPASVVACVLPARRERWTGREVAFLSWVRETGVMPAALAGLLNALHVPYAGEISGAVFISILATFVLQAGSTGWVAAKLGLLADKH